MVLGLSGGLDSITLLSVLSGLESDKRTSWKLSAVHVNHGINAAADEWDEFCQSYCKQLGVSCTSVRVSVERGSAGGLEAAARRARYAVFDKADADWLLLAHHQNDQAETLLFNLLRGTGLAGASAMSECRGRVLRPWLAVGRGEIEAFARLHRLSWCEDESNGDVQYSRNFIRHNIFSRLSNRFPAAAKNLASASFRFAESLKLLDDLARVDLQSQAGGFPVAIKSLEALDEPRARNVLRYLLARRNVRIPSEARLKEALRQMLTAGDDRHPLILLGDHQLVRRNGRVYLESPEDSCDKR